MYVKPGTTLKEIECEIRKVREELDNRRLSTEAREALHDELDYLESFLPTENY